MAKVMVHFTRDEFRTLAALVALEAFEARTVFKADPAKAERQFKVWSELHARVNTVVVNNDCEVKIDG